MEDVDCLKPVNVLGVAPIRDIVARPLDEVLEFPVSDFGIEHCHGPEAGTVAEGCES